MFTLTSIKPFALAAIATAATLGSASAAVPVTYHGTLTVTSIGTVSPASISLGDKYYFQFTLNPLVTDADSSTSWAEFNNLFTEFKVGKISGNGGWNPATVNLQGGSYGVSGGTDLTTGITITSSPGVNYTNWQGNASTASYLGFEFRFAQTPNRADTGAGQNYYQLFPFLEVTTLTGKMTVDNQSVNFTGTDFAAGEYTPAAVPEASTGLLALGALSLGVLRRSRKSVA